MEGKSIFLWEFCLHYLQSLCEHRECTSDGILWFGEEVEVLNSYGTQGEILFCILFFCSHADIENVSQSNNNPSKIYLVAGNSRKQLS